MASFKLKLKQPERILTFDDSDLSECQRSRESSSRSSSSPVPRGGAGGGVVLPRSVPNHLLLTSILEQLCIMYSSNSRQAQDIFKSICEQLARLNVVSPLLMMDEMSSLRSQYRHSVHRMLIAAIHKSNKGSLLTLMHPNGLGGYLPALPSSTPLPQQSTSRPSPRRRRGTTPSLTLPPQPSTSPEEMINQTSRYNSEFVEIDKIGQGGFGAVYKCKNKLDGKLYAIKKVKLKHSKPEVWFRVLREVKALASLQHQNIVGYNSAWLEYGVMSSSTKPAMQSFKYPDLSNNNNIDGTEDPSVVFCDSLETGTSVQSRVRFEERFEESLQWSKGPKIQELTDSLNSSSPPTQTPTSSLHRHNSHNDMLKYSTKSEFYHEEFRGRKTVLDRTGVKIGATNTTTVKSEIMKGFSNFDDDTDDGFTDSHLTGGSNVVFTLDKDSSSGHDEVDGIHSVRRGGTPGYGRSISCDPLASGETAWPDHGLVHPASFTQAEFPLQRSVTLFIQMELCGPTLKDWMQTRNERCRTEEEFISYTKTNMAVFRQILKAVDYIHSQGVIHRDLKPRNIFLREDSCLVKVGDFGLATDDIFNSPSLECTEPFFSSSPSQYSGLVRTGSMLSDHTSGVGTSTYAAPEQLDSSVYNTKSDIFSLGVVLFELFQKYATEMERYKSLSDLRKGILPGRMYELWPAQAKYVQLMTSANAEVRPSVKTILSGEMFLSKEQQLEEMRAKEVVYLNEIEKLKNLLEEKDKLLSKRNRTIDALMVELKESVEFSGTCV